MQIYLIYDHHTLLEEHVFHKCRLPFVSVRPCLPNRELGIAKTRMKAKSQLSVSDAAQCATLRSWTGSPALRVDCCKQITLTVPCLNPTPPPTTGPHLSVQAILKVFQRFSIQNNYRPRALEHTPLELCKMTLESADGKKV